MNPDRSDLPIFCQTDSRSSPTSSRVVKNDAERMTMSPADAANAVPEIYPIRAASARHGTMMNCEHDAVTLTKRHNHRSGLHPRPLLCHHEFAAGKISIGFGLQDRQLKREYVLAIEVLMQAVIIVDSILQQQRCWLRLAGPMTALNEVRVLFRITDIDTHGVVPAIGNGNQMRVDGRPQCCNEAGQRITKIFVLAAPEAVPLHYDTAAEDVVFHVQAGQCPAFLRRKNRLDHRAPLRIEIL